MRVSGKGFGTWGVGCRVEDLGVGVWGEAFTVWCLGVWGSEFRILGSKGS